MCCILPNDQKIENEGWFFALRSQYKLYMTASKYCDWNEKDSAYWKMVGNVDKMTKIIIYYLIMCFLQLKKMGQILITPHNYMDC